MEADRKRTQITSVFVHAGSCARSVPCLLSSLFVSPKSVLALLLLQLFNCSHSLCCVVTAPPAMLSILRCDPPVWVATNTGA